MTRRRAGQSYLDVVRDAGVRAPAVEAWAEKVVDTASPSVQLAVFRAGELAVSVAGGRHDGGRRHVTRDSLHLLYSSTKLYTALTMWTLRERGFFDWDDTVASHWPEFAQNGKQDVTIRHVLAHRGGIEREPDGTTWTRWGDPEGVAGMVEGLGLKWKPGEAQGYHNRTFGFMLDTLVRRWTGAGLDEVFRREVAGPLGVDGFHFPLADRALFDERFVKTETPVLEPMPQRSRDEFRPFIGGELNLFNSWELVRLPMAWGTATATAEAAAEVACFVAGRGLHRAVRLCSEDVFAQATECQSREGEIDSTLRRPARWGLGVQIDMFRDLPSLGPVIGHGGGTTVQVWAAPERELAVACMLGGHRQGAGEVYGGALPARWTASLAQAVQQDFAP